MKLNSRVFLCNNRRNNKHVDMQHRDIEAIALHELLYARSGRVNGVIKAPNYKALASSLNMGAERFKRILNRMLWLDIAQISTCDNVRAIRLLNTENMMRIDLYSHKRKRKFLYRKGTVSKMSFNDSVHYIQRFMLMAELERQRHRAYQFVDRTVFNKLSPLNLKEHRRNLKALRNNSTRRNDATRLDRGLIRTSDKHLSKLLKCSTATANKTKRYWQSTNMFNLRTINVIDGKDMTPDIFHTLKDSNLIPSNSFLNNGACIINIGTLVCCTDNNDVRLNYASDRNVIKRCFIEQAYKLLKEKCLITSNDKDYRFKYNLLLKHIKSNNGSPLYDPA